MKPKIITEQAGRHIEQSRSPIGLFYYPAKNLDGHRLMWVGIKNLPGEFERRKFVEFRECLEWLLESAENDEKGGE